MTIDYYKAYAGFAIKGAFLDQPYYRVSRIMKYGSMNGVTDKIHAM